LTAIAHPRPWSGRLAKAAKPMRCRAKQLKNIWQWRQQSRRTQRKLPFAPPPVKENEQEATGILRKNAGVLPEVVSRPKQCRVHNTTVKKKSNLSLSSYAAHRHLRKKPRRWQTDTRQGRLPERKERGSDASCEPVPSAVKAESRLDPSVCKTRHALRGVTATSRKDGLPAKSSRGSFSKVRQKPEKSLREAVEPLD